MVGLFYAFHGMRQASIHHRIYRDMDLLRFGWMDELRLSPFSGTQVKVAGGCSV